MGSPTKRLEKIAKKIARLEKSLEFCSDDQYINIRNEIEDISRKLPIDDMMWVDDYIMSHHLIS